eukprot:1739707-Amphidinium_carterae.1
MRPLHFKGSCFYRVVPGLVIEGGDIIRGPFAHCFKPQHNLDSVETSDAHNAILKPRSITCPVAAGCGVLSISDTTSRNSRRAAWSVKCIFSGDGSGGESAFGETFADEDCIDDLACCTKSDLSLDVVTEG